MRRIVLDTETTGLEPEQGHRIIEIACIELDSRRPTGRQLHRYFNPERDIDIAATQVHGMTAEDLVDKPLFAELADELLDFLSGAELLIHNAPFDVAFINAELARVQRPPIESVCTVVDTLAMARELNPGKRNSLDALCERYGVDNSRRTLHGALLDTQLLFEVWLGLTRGQDSLAIDLSVPAAGIDAIEATRPARLRVIIADAEEIARHAAMCARIAREAGGRCLWNDAPATVQ